ncbi:hypothetical protein PF005_g15305 [Phytophthora fragariae]|uniref:Uncharacterized protein n=1 Tax=Phytophthora fragariae TaxID=53985 RepID=A0A6A3XV47_9STRA|nr:hypothetical protein PF003_g16165 [Phytophthora fragariae]KAE8900064.1 hypothetical protein PF003_g16223 [Phytophthora fragariae]KAE8930167.1 hypothetical protein PF009_g19733 [Phytophthora fragariae]KAE9099456.1 hypothetical protein PF007_g15876 [Phytophthora fragariae]KAE9122989.1 hypothetical protein PF006_g17527 [Phytophthora fragariae]
MIAAVGAAGSAASTDAPVVAAAAGSGASSDAAAAGSAALKGAAAAVAGSAASTDAASGHLLMVSPRSYVRAVVDAPELVMPTNEFRGR